MLPRISPDYLPGPGGHKSFKLVWEESKELPAGFTKKTVGFPRVGNNCALCHTGTWRSKPDETPHVVIGAPSHTTDVQGLLRFLAKCGQDSRFNATTILGEIDRERMDTWNQAAADQANEAVKKLGIIRPNMAKQAGYQSPPLDGLRMRAPYLHNGSVPSLRDLLEPPDKRTRAFYRDYDVYDPVNVGFITSGPEAERAGWLLDTRRRGNGNAGHTYGTRLPEDEKAALVEFLKTL